MEMIDGNGLTHATYHWREREVGGCGDKCPNGTECPHPSHGADHPDKADATTFHEYAVEYGPDHISFAFDGQVRKLRTSTSFCEPQNPLCSRGSQRHATPHASCCVRRMPLPASLECLRLSGADGLAIRCCGVPDSRGPGVRDDHQEHDGHGNFDIILAPFRTVVSAVYHHPTRAVWEILLCCVRRRDVETWDPSCSDRTF